MNKLVNIILTLLIFSTILFAQSRLELERVLRNLERRWQATNNLALKYNNQEAINLLQKAKANYEQALRLINKQEWALAKMKLVRADLQIKTAGRLVFNNHEVRFRNELNKIMRRAEHAVFQSRNEDARYFYNKARVFRDKANNAYQHSEYIRSQELYRVATYFAKKSLELSARGTSFKYDKSTLEEYYRNIERLLQETTSKDLLNNNQPDLLQKAKEFINRSKKLYQDGDIDEALVKLQIAERLLYRAVDLTGGADGTRNENLRENLSSLRRFLDGIDQSVMGKQNAKIAQFQNKAEQYYNSAMRDYENEYYKKARQKIFLSQRLGSRALQLTGEGQDIQSTRIDNRLYEVERLLQLQSQKIKSSENETALHLHEQAREFFKEAEQARDKQNLTTAYHRLQLSLRFINRAESQLNLTQKTNFSSNDLQERYNRLQRTIQSLNFDNDQRNMEMTFKKLLNQTEKSLNNGKKELTASHLEILETQVNDYLRATIH